MKRSVSCWRNLESRPMFVRKRFRVLNQNMWRIAGAMGLCDKRLSAIRFRIRSQRTSDGLRHSRRGNSVAAMTTGEWNPDSTARGGAKRYRGVAGARTTRLSRTGGLNATLEEKARLVCALVSECRAGSAQTEGLHQQPSRRTHCRTYFEQSSKIQKLGPIRKAWTVGQGADSLT